MFQLFALLKKHPDVQIKFRYSTLIEGGQACVERVFRDPNGDKKKDIYQQKVVYFHDDEIRRAKNDIAYLELERAFQEVDTEPTRK